MKKSVVVSFVANFYLMRNCLFAEDVFLKDEIRPGGSA